MPYTETQRKAALAEVARRKMGGKAGSFKGMGTKDLAEYASEPLKKKKGHKTVDLMDKAMNR